MTEANAETAFSSMSGELALYVAQIAFSMLVWSLVQKGDASSIKIFYLTCVVVAGIFGALTAKASILIVQGAPALAAFVLIVLSRPGSDLGRP